MVVNLEDAVQISSYKQEIFTSKYGLKIPKSKTKIMALKGRNPAGSKIIINNNSIEKINTFNCLGCSNSFQNKKDIAVKISKFLQTPGIINVI
jgi:hypothetical protein